MSYLFPGNTPLAPLRPGFLGSSSATMGVGVSRGPSPSYRHHAPLRGKGGKAGWFWGSGSGRVEACRLAFIGQRGWTLGSGRARFWLAGLRAPSGNLRSAGWLRPCALWKVFPPSEALIEMWVTLKIPAQSAELNAWPNSWTVTQPRWHVQGTRALAPLWT